LICVLFQFLLLDLDFTLNAASIVNSLSRNAGGLFESVRRLHQSLGEIPGLTISVYGMCDEFTDADIAEWMPVNVHAYAIIGPRAFGYAPALRRDLLVAGDDILHVHGLWQYPSVVAPAWHQKLSRPYLISAHGMLDPWALNNSAWKKRLALLLYERENLKRAACIRALCDSEANSIRAFGLKSPICIIPNGIDLPDDEERRTEAGKQTSDLWPLASGKKVLLYLGRIHPKKGVANLLKAWAAVQKAENRKQKAEEWVLAIAGWDQGGHEAELKRLATELGLSLADVRDQKSAIRNLTSDLRPPTSGPLHPSSVVRRPPSVVFLGPQFNEAKTACYQYCDAFILPSVSEGLPMVVLEAWAHGKPVLMTPECNLPEGFAANAAIRIDPSVESIARGLADLLHAPWSMLQALGTNGRALVAARFTWPKIAAEMKSVYEWVLGGGPKPNSVL
jgi:poly(glycerol-phosphate) alpha-glucosyltransferase